MYIINTWREGVEKMELDPVNRQEAIAQTEIQKIQFKHKIKTSVLWGWSNSGTRCPERLLSLHPWRHTHTDWIELWTTCSGWSYLPRGLDQMLSRGACLAQPLGDPVLLSNCIQPSTNWQPPPDIFFCQTAYHHQLLCVFAVTHIARFCMFAVIHVLIAVHTLQITRLFLKCLTWFQLKPY